MTLPKDAAARKNVPIFSGVLRYFPDALAAVAEVSRIGSQQHNPGKPMQWDRSKSKDEADCLVRHLIDAGTIDTDGTRHTAKVAWRALALLQKEIEAERESGAAPRDGAGLVLPSITQELARTGPEPAAPRERGPGHFPQDIEI